eukprot:jgi/Chlat1/506/Chrsp103S01105
MVPQSVKVVSMWSAAPGMGTGTLADQCGRGRRDIEVVDGLVESHWQWHDACCLARSGIDECSPEALEPGRI